VEFSSADPELKQYGEMHKARILKEISLLKNWFYEMTETSLGNVDLEFLVKHLIHQEYLPYSQKDLFFTTWHAKKLVAPIQLNKEHQKSFNKDIENYMIRHKLCWEYYRAYLKSELKP